LLSSEQSTLQIVRKRLIKLKSSAFTGALPGFIPSSADALKNMLCGKTALLPFGLFHRTVRAGCEETDAYRNCLAMNRAADNASFGAGFSPSSQALRQRKAAL